MAGRVDRAARAGAHDGGDLRHHARGQRVAQEDVGVAAQGGHALLDARAARVVEADHGRAHLHGQVHHLADLARVGLGEAAAEHGEVLREDEDQAAVHAPVAGDDAVAGDLLLGHAEVEAAVLDQLVQLLEAALVEQQLDALARGELALRVLALAALGAAALLGARDFSASVGRGRSAHGREALPGASGALSGPAAAAAAAAAAPAHARPRSRRAGHGEGRELLLDRAAPRRRGSVTASPKRARTLEGRPAAPGRRIRRAGIGLARATWRASSFLAFSQSSRNRLRPMSVSGCLSRALKHGVGHGADVGAQLAASTTCMGWRRLAASTSQS